MTHFKPLLPVTLVAAALLVNAAGERGQAAAPAAGEMGAVADSANQAPAHKGVAIGDQGPAFKGLEGVDGKTHSLGDYKDAQLVVVAFTCNHCPVAKAYEDRLIELAKDYKDRGVQLVAINVNNIEPDRLPKMKERAAEKGFDFPYLVDPSQQIGHAYGATVTPHVFVLDRDRNVAYMGAIDDNMKEDKVTQHHLRDALDALLADQAVAANTTQQFGCGIKYE